MDASAPTHGTALEASPEVLTEIRDALEPGLAAEPCGYLLGRRTDARVRVTRLEHGANVHPRPQHAFLLAPEEQLAVRRQARGAGLELVGFWHGHPHGPPRPSHADLAGIGPVAPPIVLIAGREDLADPVIVRAWEMRDGQATEIAITSSPRPRPPPR